MTKPILYVHSGLLAEAPNLSERIALFEESFKDIAHVTFDFGGGLNFEEFLRGGEPKVYLTDWIPHSYGRDPNLMEGIFRGIRENHPRVKIIAAREEYVAGAYQKFQREGIIDILLKSKSVASLVPPPGNPFGSEYKEEDIETIREALEA